MTTKIEIVRPDDPRVRLALEGVNQLTRAIIFGGDRWMPVEWVGLAIQPPGLLGLGGERVVGIATLAPTDEMGADVPSIIGVWAHPDHRRQGVGLALITALAAECQRLYGRAPSIQAISPAGAAVCRRAQLEGVQMQLNDVSVAMGFWLE